jgi:hypothetical protein
MNIHVAIQNTVAQFQGMVIETITCQNNFWRILVAKNDMTIEFEVDEVTHMICVLEKKNLGYKSLSRFMNAFLEEIQSMEGDEDPINPARD